MCAVRRQADDPLSWASPKGLSGQDVGSGDELDELAVTLNRRERAEHEAAATLDWFLLVKPA